MSQFQVRTDLALETREKFQEDHVEIKGVRVEEEYQSTYSNIERKKRLRSRQW